MRRPAAPPKLGIRVGRNGGAGSGWRRAPLPSETVLAHESPLRPGPGKEGCAPLLRETLEAARPGDRQTPAGMPRAPPRSPPGEGRAPLPPPEGALGSPRAPPRTRRLSNPPPPAPTRRTFLRPTLRRPLHVRTCHLLLPPAPGCSSFLLLPPRSGQDWPGGEGAAAAVVGGRLSVDAPQRQGAAPALERNGRDMRWPAVRDPSWGGSEDPRTFRPSQTT